MKNTPAPSRSPFFRVAMVSTALAFGIMCSTVFALGRGAGGLFFEFGLKSGIAFFVGAGIAWGFWSVILSQTVSRGKIVFASLGLMAVGLVCFLLPLRYVADTNRRDLIEGLLLAFAALTVLGIVFYKLVKFLEKDAAS